MCLAVPGQVIECSGDQAIVDLKGNRIPISRVLTPEAVCGDWVLVHAGFAITKIEERDALETWDYLAQAYQPEVADEVRSAANETFQERGRGP